MACWVGGARVEVGGWGEYEISRRRAEFEAGGARPRAAYLEGTHITAADAVASIIGGAQSGRRTALQRAAERLAAQLGALEDDTPDPEAGSGWVPAGGAYYMALPPLSSRELRELGHPNADELQDLTSAVEAVAATVEAAGAADETKAGQPVALPPLPARVVALSDDEGVLRLEASVGPHVAGLEALQARLAGRMDVVAAALEKRRGRALESARAQY